MWRREIVNVSLFLFSFSLLFVMSLPILCHRFVSMVSCGPKVVDFDFISPMSRYQHLIAKDSI